MKKERNTNIEILRLFLICGVCIWHIFIWGYNMRYLGHEKYLHETWLWLYLFTCAFCSPSVYCFMFISGYYGIRPSLYKFGTLVLTGLLCLLFGTWLRWEIWNVFNLKSLLRHLFTVSSNQWWFLTNYILVFLVSPFVNTAVHFMSNKVLMHSISLLTIMQIGFFIGICDITSGSSFFGLVYMYILGRTFSEKGIAIRLKTSLIIYVISLLLLYTCLVLTSLFPIGRKFTTPLLSYANPLVIIMSICLFYIVNNIRPYYSKITNQLLSGILVVYLVTELLGKPFYRYFAIEIDKSAIWGMLEYLIILLCLLFSGFIIMYFSKLLVGFVLNTHACLYIRQTFLGKIIRHI